SGQNDQRHASGSCPLTWLARSGSCPHRAALGYARLHWPIPKPPGKTHFDRENRGKRVASRATLLISPRLSKRALSWVLRYAECGLQQGAGRRLAVGQEWLDQTRRRQLKSSAGEGNRQLAGFVADQGDRPPLRGHGDLRRNPGKRPRLRRF